MNVFLTLRNEWGKLKCCSYYGIFARPTIPSIVKFLTPDVWDDNYAPAMIVLRNTTIVPNFSDDNCISVMKEQYIEFYISVHGMFLYSVFLCGSWRKTVKNEIHFMHRAFLNDPGFENVIEQRKYFVICFLMKLCKQEQCFDV